MIFDTLQYVDGNGVAQEVALPLSNLATVAGAVSLKLNPKSHAPGECIITWAQPPETGIAIPFRSPCIVRTGRQSGDGSQNSFSGGTIIFQGRRWDNEGSASKSQVATTITLLDAWKELEKITFQIAWQEITGGTISAPTYSNFLWPDIVLMQPAPGRVYAPAPAGAQFITTWQQIQDIITFVQTFLTGANAVQLALGPLGFAPLYCNWYPVRSQSCGDCLKFVLRAHPGVFTEMDYTTTPPTLNFRNAGTVSPITLPYKSKLADGTLHMASEIQSLEELKPDAVRLFYRITGEFNGQQVGTFGTDIYPNGAPNSPLCLDYSIDVTGASVTETIKNFVSNNFNPTDLTLWRTKVPGLKQIAQGGQIPNDGSAGALTFVSTAPYDSVSNPKGFQVIDDIGNPIDFADTFLYWTDQSVYSWFNLSGPAAQAVKATVKAFFSYNKTSTIGGTAVTDTMKEHEHHLRVVLTNAPTNQYFIKTTQPGEAIPTGLAQALWTELQTLQWKLRHEIIQAAPDTVTVPTLIKPGKHAINLSGGDPTWATMNAMPQNVSIQLFRTADGRLVAHHNIQTGPVNHLEPGYLIQLANLFWNRNRSGVRSDQRLSGAASSNQVDLTGTDSKENSTAAAPVPTVQNLVATDNTGAITGLIIHSAPIIATTLAATTPAPVTGFSATDLKTMQPREIKVCDDNGNPYFMMVMATGGYTKS
jgi:hypothetical protein